MTDFWKRAKELKKEIIHTRRDLHMHPESAWTEFRTASLVASSLEKWGFEVLVGEDFIKTEDLRGVPLKETLERAKERAISEGARAKWLKKMVNGKTAVLGIMKFKHPGKTVGLRFDMDANTVEETIDPKHFPQKKGFTSVHEGLMHACGHDGHTTIGLFVAKLLSEAKEEMRGTIKIFFQPAEEGACGARAIVGSGEVDDCDYFLAGHIGLTANRDDLIVCMAKDFLATTKFDAEFTGASCHAGSDPNLGKNALLAAAKATVELYELPKTLKGLTRINVGVFEGGAARNIIADKAFLKMETRGETTSFDQAIYKKAQKVLRNAAEFYGCTVKIKEIGSAYSGKDNKKMARKVYDILKTSGEYKEVILSQSFGASEDCTRIMKRVQDKGGQALFMMFGSKLTAGNHNPAFDFNEELLPKTVGSVATLAEFFLR